MGALVVKFATPEACLDRASYVKAQRWGGAFYSNADAGDMMCFVDRARKLALCGDCCAPSSTAENAMLSGVAAGKAIAEALGKTAL
ncbi:hypothetical protein HOP50_11g64030 [Chloropicon primus]|uniref:Amine oxidase domain-containing protein n=1 Tax=Chloropicon primus TaxID=1764295 RepID=A0A5B8MTM8_9CHLO|nr:hypothetical protein A3770_11p63810 [Chloropicon primus]UPR03076.1 hypothetical protein HOP50_11g64030 [Chloropicon primus]|eukprot:QDZ23863.1 hypothetical protein A3770_11p63810 [Chloropicon primus]